jgi:membrane-associated phospholipid phosphatase
MKLPKNIFLLLFLVYAFVGIFLLVFCERGTVVLWLNGFHHPYLDFFFRHITHLGDGIFLAILCVLLLFWRYYYAVLCLIAYLLSGIPVRIGKDLLWADALRPQPYFEQKGIILHLVEGVEIHTYKSFPSGHSATSFAIFCIIALLCKNKAQQALCFALAFAVVVSRMYLCQHFWVDTYTGACLGTGSALCAFYAVNTYTSLAQQHKSLLKHG